MRISIPSPRKDYFRFATSNWTAKDVLLPFVTGKTNITVKDIERLDRDKIIVGTKEGSLESLLREKIYTRDTPSMIERVDNLSEDQILVLPSDYRRSGAQGREQRAYSMETLVDLDSTGIRQIVLGDKNPRRRLTKQEKERFKLDPATVYRAAIQLMNENPREFITKQTMGFRWRGTDDSLRVIRTLNLVEMLELRMLQNLAYYKIQFPEDKKKWRSEVTTGYNSETKEKLKPAQIRNRQLKIEKFEKHLRSQMGEFSLQYFVDLLELRTRDIIDVRTFNLGRAAQCKSPSRTNIYKQHNFSLDNLANTYLNNQLRFSLVWDILTNCNCEDFKYNTQRRAHSRNGPAKKENYLCSHTMAGVLGAQAIYQFRGRSEKIHILPFPLPTPSLIEATDKLRYQTVILEQTENGRWSKRALNKAEIGEILTSKLALQPYDTNLVDNSKSYLDRFGDPIKHTLKFRT